MKVFYCRINCKNYQDCLNNNFDNTDFSEQFRRNYAQRNKDISKIKMPQISVFTRHCIRIHKLLDAGITIDMNELSVQEVEGICTIKDAQGENIKRSLDNNVS